MKLLKNAFKHLCLITKHKYFVFKECCKVGLYWRGLIHDLSKYSPTEFLESIKFYTGNSSPIDECKKVKGYSNAWLHHKGRNKHHYEYWQDNFDNGTNHIMMPCKYAMEMVCDYLGAARAYMGKEFTYKKEFDWYVNTKMKTATAMNPYIREYMYIMLYLIGVRRIPLTKKLAEIIYANLDFVRLFAKEDMTNIYIIYNNRRFIIDYRKTPGNIKVNYIEEVNENDTFYKR